MGCGSSYVSRLMREGCFCFCLLLNIFTFGLSKANNTVREDLKLPGLQELLQDAII